MELKMNKLCERDEVKDVLHRKLMSQAGLDYRECTECAYKGQGRGGRGACACIL